MRRCNHFSPFAVDILQFIIRFHYVEPLLMSTKVAFRNQSSNTIKPLPDTCIFGHFAEERLLIQIHPFHILRLIVSCEIAPPAEGTRYQRALMTVPGAKGIWHFLHLQADEEERKWKNSQNNDKGNNKNNHKSNSNIRHSDSFLIILFAVSFFIPEHLLMLRPL